MKRRRVSAVRDGVVRRGGYRNGERAGVAGTSKCVGVGSLMSAVRRGRLAYGEL